MSKLKQLLLQGLFASAFLFTDYAQAYIPWSDISVAAGWRRDEIQNLSFLTVPSGPATGTTFDIQGKAKEINIWEIGIQGRFTIPQSCNFAFEYLSNRLIDQFFIDGSAFWGWTTDGHIGRTIVTTPTTGISTTTLITDSIHDGHTHDYTIGGGLIIPVTCAFGIGPTAGYAWNKIAYNVQNQISHTETKWRGPWLGFEADFAMYEWSFDAGYQYHWTNISNTFKGRSNPLNTTTSSATRSHKHGKGHVAFIDAWWAYNDHIDVGLGFKYTYFKSNDQIATGTFVDILLPPPGLVSIVGLVKTTWRSYAATVDVAYRF